MQKSICGIDVGALPNQFEGCVVGRTLILDGDGPAYRASATAKTLPTCIRRFQTEVLTLLYLTRSERAIVHLTAASSHKAGRFNIIAHKPYQGNRTGKAKPPLLEATRQAVAMEENWLPEYVVKMNHIVEADDAMIMDAYRLKEDGLIWSDDKDLRMTKYPYWETKKGAMLSSIESGAGSLWLDKSTTTTKCLGHGLKFFWAQMLMGDTADNIKGIIKYDNKLCGPAAAYEALNLAVTESECANIVLDGYRAIDQNPLPEGWLLWLLRWENDSFWVYLNSLELSPKNQAFVMDCANRNWFKQAEPKQEEEEVDVPWD